MSFTHESKDCYSNEAYYEERKDTFVDSQARQAKEFVEELIEQRDTAQEAKLLLKAKADNLLRITKSRAIQWLKDNEFKLETRLEAPASS